ncbi:threonine/homoserine/homoserine lactone efflux protein [Saccharothrix tamanrassetensis]|uniref:Threonine/homoserine/homoserine lactone efflux protein n=1 Tax=Saccharothrix tamanrassetensis TaxID=1051531 RepID=A0A841CER8_9PSEU|nr:hypothetical protein [Saccharothrix tamanrassetensis]MBB5954864.1 threonine/homoserine/homoserine lactone efflux protein [Saccharothrix tamanrassetensis]
MARRDHLSYLTPWIFFTPTHQEDAPRQGHPLRKQFPTATTNPEPPLTSTAFVPQFAAPSRGGIPTRPTLLDTVHLAAEALAGTGCATTGAVIRKANLTARAKRRLDPGTGTVLPGLAGLPATGATATAGRT